MYNEVCIVGPESMGKEVVGGVWWSSRGAGTRFVGITT